MAELGRPGIVDGDAWTTIGAARRLENVLTARLDQSLDGCAISFGQLEVLRLIGRDRNTHAAALARELDVSRQAVSAAIRRLSRADLVELLPPEYGMRVAQITRVGRRRIELAEQSTARIRRRIETIDQAERAQWVHTTEALIHAVAQSYSTWWWDDS